jgi:hypothetical protein
MITEDSRHIGGRRASENPAPIDQARRLVIEWTTQL